MASTEPFRIEPDEWYLSRALRKTWNVLLKLDDGKLLPAHSLFLALRMPVFARMLGDGGLLASASTLNVVTVPFSGCSLLEARKFLSVVYSHESAERHINDDTNLSIARISHMYEWKVRHLTMDCTSLLAVRSPCVNERSFTSRACTAGFGGAHQ